MRVALRSSTENASKRMFFRHTHAKLPPSTLPTSHPFQKLHSKNSFIYFWPFSKILEIKCMFSISGADYLFFFTTQFCNETS
jgi:hypothetical protein